MSSRTGTSPSRRPTSARSRATCRASSRRWVHFWDWIWWIATKAAAGRDDLVAEHLPQLHAHLLGPLGVPAPPASIDAAIAAYVPRRDAFAREYGVGLPRALEDEVRAGIRRVVPAR